MTKAKDPGAMPNNKDIRGLAEKSYRQGKAHRWIRNNWGFVFIIPWLVGVLVFKMYPFLSSLYYSFTDFHLFNGIKEYGFMNYEEIFTDRANTKALGTTFAYAFMTVPLKLVAALFIAYILNFKIKFVNTFRTAYYIPSILGGSVAIAVLWKALFRDEGLINTLLGFFSIDGPKWLSDPKYALFIICLLRIWQFGSAMIIFLAALKGVPEDLYEAATIDGASKARQLFSITIPLITPVIFYNLVTQLVQAFQEFNGPYIITQGGPRSSTTLISLLIYQNAFRSYEMGLASAEAWVMFIILMVFTIISFVSQKYWVYYSDDNT
jgi:oligogalacturonide transport system permease protein